MKDRAEPKQAASNKPSLCLVSSERKAWQRFSPQTVKDEFHPLVVPASVRNRALGAGTITTVANRFRKVVDHRGKTPSAAAYGSPDVQLHI
ncbi:hypothetical protein ACFXS9_25955 [Bradyrhizobium sp. RDI18]